MYNHIDKQGKTLMTAPEKMQVRTNVPYASVLYYAWPATIDVFEDPHEWSRLMPATWRTDSYRPIDILFEEIWAEWFEFVTTHQPNRRLPDSGVHSKGDCRHWTFVF